MGKSFKDAMRAKQAAENPALQFITPPTVETAEEPQAEEPRKVTRRPAAKRGKKTSAPVRTAYTEPKSRRLQLLIQPSLYEDVKELSEAEGLSVNETISELLKEAITAREAK